jgi:hypothetical protein
MKFLSLCAKAQEEESNSLGSANLKDVTARREGALWLADRQLEILELLEEHAEERSIGEVEAEVRSRCLPPADVTDKILRYEAHLESQLYRAMDQLERLQPQRKGERVPPPLHVNLGRRI